MPNILRILERPSVGKVIEISVDVQAFIERVRLTKENVHPYYSSSFILGIEDAAQAKIESFSLNWHLLIQAIAKNKDLSNDVRVMTLESIANDASKLIDA